MTCTSVFFPVRSLQVVCDTPLQFAATLLGAGKPCRAPGEHFPGRENLAAFRGNIFPDGKTLPRSGGTFFQTGKPCRVPGEHFPRQENLARFQGRLSPIICSLLSFPVRPPQGVCDTPLQFLRENFLLSFPVRPHQGVCDTPLQLSTVWCCQS